MGAAVVWLGKTLLVIVNAAWIADLVGEASAGFGLDDLIEWLHGRFGAEADDPSSPAFATLTPGARTYWIGELGHWSAYAQEHVPAGWFGFVSPVLAGAEEIINDPASTLAEVAYAIHLVDYAISRVMVSAGGDATDLEYQRAEQVVANPAVVQGGYLPPIAVSTLAPAPGSPASSSAPSSGSTTGAAALPALGGLLGGNVVAPSPSPAASSSGPATALGAVSPGGSGWIIAAGVLLIGAALLWRGEG